MTGVQTCALPISYITQAGRCYMQVGNDELFELFQSGFSGAVYEENSGQKKTLVAQMLSLTGKTDLIGRRRKAPKIKAGQERTQLDAVVDYLQELAEKNGYTRMLQLWLPDLPVNLYLGQLEGYKSWSGVGMWQWDKKEWVLETPIGLYDNPASQAQGKIGRAHV